MRMAATIRPDVNVSSHRTVNAGWALLVVVLAACSGAKSEGPPPAPATAPALRQGCTSVGGGPCLPSGPPSPPAARRIELAPACRGAVHLAANAAALDDDAWACACRETESMGRSVRAGSWCGLPQANEGLPMELTVVAESTVLAPGEGVRVRIRLRNPNPTAATYRLPDRHLSARFVDLGGNPLTDVHHSGPYRDEGLVELAPGGDLEISLEVAGTYARWSGSGADARIEQRRLAPGRYAVQVFVGGLGGEASRSVPIEVREGAAGLKGH